MSRIAIFVWSVVLPWSAAGSEVGRLMALLDLNRPEMQIVKERHAAGDDNGALAAWNELLRKRLPRSEISLKVINNVQRDADEALRLRFRSRPSDKYYQLHQEFEWNKRPEEISEHHWLSLLVSLHQLNFLADVYLKTGDSAYAEGCVRLYDDWAQHCPPGSGAPSWSLATTLIRSGVLLRVVQRLLYWPDWPPEAQARMMIGLHDHLEVMVAKRGPGNQDAANSEHLMRIASALPEFARADTWLDTGYSRISERIFEDVLPDGTQRELTTGYHQNAINTYTLVAERMAEAGKPLTPAYRQLLEKMYEWCMVLVRPDGSGPVNGDAVGSSMMPYLSSGAALFNRPDMAYIATRGEKGQQPNFLDGALPEAGYYSMRSSWTDPNGIYVFMDVSRQPVVSHQDYDALHIDLFAYGRDFLPDKGTYTYGGDYHKAAKATASHSTVTIDGRNQRDTPATCHYHGTASMVSLIDGSIEGTPGIVHRRQTCLVKGSDGVLPYVIVVDRITGTGRHQVDQLFHLAPGEVKLAPELGQAAVRTADDDSANLVIWQLLDGGLNTEIYASDMHPRQGVTVARPAVRFRHESALPVTYATLLLPFQGADCPGVHATATMVPGSNDTVKIAVSFADTRDELTIATGPAAVESKNQAVLDLRRIRSGAPTVMEQLP